MASELAFEARQGSSAPLGTSFISLGLSFPITTMGMTLQICRFVVIYHCCIYIGMSM